MLPTCTVREKPSPSPEVYACSSGAPAETLTSVAENELTTNSVIVSAKPTPVTVTMALEARYSLPSESVTTLSGLPSKLITILSPTS
jgi:hypothetical protein